MIFALIPAGGKSERMGRAKLLLPFHGRTVLECVINAFQEARVDRVLVLASPELPILAEIAKTAGVDGIVLPQPTAAMRETIVYGLNWAEQHWQLGSEDAWLLSPADHPTLRPKVIRLLIAERERNRSHSIFIPAHNRRRGHPALISWPHVDGIRQLPPEVGINAYLRSQQSATLEVKVDDPSIMVDLDTPEDYEKLCEM